MPPANSPQPDPGQPPSFISALRELESPVNEDVLNLAATLGTQPDDAFDEPEHQRVNRQRETLRLLERQREELEQRNRLRRVMDRLSRLSDNTGAYSDRVPGPNYNNLYDWAPANETAPANEAEDELELDQILAELRREQPNTHPEILRVLGQSQLDSERARVRYQASRIPYVLSSGSGSTEGSLRSTAILQNVRRHPRFSARTREYLQRQQAERESTSRTEQRSPSRDRYSTERSTRQATMQTRSDSRTSVDRPPRSGLSRADSYRRNYLERTSNSNPIVSPVLEQTVKYLSQIRHSNSEEESIEHALNAGLLSHILPNTGASRDFITESFSIPLPAETSWLAPGAVLSGCQHATSGAAPLTVPHAASSSSLRRYDQGFLPPLPWVAPPSQHPQHWGPNSVPSSQTNLDGSTLQTSHPEQWPVKVTIHAVDWEKMSLSATMEAWNVPSNPYLYQSILNSSDNATNPPVFTRTSSITTYLEGEILDFNNHTLLTESFKSNAGNDATYWRKLPPFAKMSDDDIVSALTSRKWFTETLSKEWILMRWKERCFVKSLHRSTPNPGLSNQPVQPPNGDDDSTYRSDQDVSMSGAAASQSRLQLPRPVNTATTSPYRIVRNSTTGLAEVEISPTPDASSSSANANANANRSATPDTEHATFDDSGCGLTISGFYYVCLRRSDGRLEGLYYDPQSSPYQCLKLESVRGGGRPAWGFR